MQEKRDPRLDEEEKKKYIEGPQSATQGKWVEERERECEGEDEMHFLTGWLAGSSTKTPACELAREWVVYQAFKRGAQKSDERPRLE